MPGAENVVLNLNKDKIEWPDAQFTSKIFVNDKSALSREALQELTRAITTLPHSTQFVISLGLDFNDDSPLTEQQTSIVTKLSHLLKPHCTELGVENMSATRLRSLGDLPISIDQIDADECCVLPKDILDLQREKKLRLLAHHDARDLVSANCLAKSQSLDKWDFIIRIGATDTTRQVFLGYTWVVVPNA